MAESDHAIVIGINSYPGLGDLVGAVNDAKRFTGWLKDPEKGDVPEDQIATIFSENSGSESPNFSEIDHKFKHLVKKIVQNDGYLGGRLYLYFSGHGLAIDDVVGLITADADKAFYMPAFPGDKAGLALSRLGAFDEILLFMDCCRDDFSKLDVMPLVWEKLLLSSGMETKYFFAYAARFGKKAREIEVDGEPVGLFTHFLLKGLDGEGADSSGKITGTSLSAYIEQKVISHEKNRKRIKPEFKLSSITDDFVIREVPAAETTVSFKVNGADAPEIIIQDNQYQVIKKIPITGPVMEEKLPNGMYIAILAGTTKMKAFEIKGKEGNHVEF